LAAKRFGEQLPGGVGRGTTAHGASRRALLERGTALFPIHSQCSRDLLGVGGPEFGGPVPIGQHLVKSIS